MAVAADRGHRRTANRRQVYLMPSELFTSLLEAGFKVAAGALAVAHQAELTRAERTCSAPQSQPASGTTEDVPIKTKKPRRRSPGHRPCEQGLAADQRYRAATARFV